MKNNKNGDQRGMSPNSQRNLGKGREGNNHAKKDYSITRIIKEMLDDPATERWLEVEDKGKQLTWRQAIAKRILVEAVRGNARVTAELLDRLEGKVTQPLGGDPDQPIKIKVVYEEAATQILNPVQPILDADGNVIPDYE